MSRFNLSTAAVDAIRNTLVANTTLAALLRFPGAPATEMRVYGENVPPDVPIPYITIEWYGGGKDNDTRTDAAMTYWKVAAHTKEDPALAENLQNLIFAALDWKFPVIASDKGYAGYAPILFKYPYTDTAFRSGVTLQRSGGIYSLALAETKE